MDKNNTCDQCIDLRVAQVGEPDTTTEIVCREDPSAAGGGSTRTSGTCSGGGAGGAGTVGSSGALGLQNASSVGWWRFGAGGCTGLSGLRFREDMVNKERICGRPVYIPSRV